MSSSGEVATLDRMTHDAHYTHLCIQADSVINGQFTLGTGPSIW